MSLDDFRNKPRPNLLKAKVSEDRIELSGVPTNQAVEISPELYAELYGMGMAAGALCDGFRDKLQTEAEPGKTARLIVAELEAEFTIQSVEQKTGVLFLKISSDSKTRVLRCKAKPKIIIE